jgi:hypothetical protein
VLRRRLLSPWKLAPSLALRNSSSRFICSLSFGYLSFMITCLTARIYSLSLKFSHKFFKIPNPFKVVAGNEGCSLVHVPYSDIIKIGRKDSLFQIRLYQSLFILTWKILLQIQSKFSDVANSSSASTTVRLFFLYSLFNFLP